MHWRRRHKSVCRLLVYLIANAKDAKGGGVRVDAFTARAFNSMRMSAEVSDEGCAGRGLRTTHAVSQSTIVALFINKSHDVRTMDEFRYTVSGKACVVDDPALLADEMNGSLANDICAEGDLRALCAHPGDNPWDDFVARMCAFAYDYSVDGARTLAGRPDTVGTARIVTAEEAGLSFDGVVLLASRDLPAGARLLWHYGLSYWLNMIAADCMPWSTHPMARWCANMMLLRGCRRIAHTIAEASEYALVPKGAAAASVGKMPQISRKLEDCIMSATNLAPRLPSWLHYRTGAPGMYSCVYGRSGVGAYDGPDLSTRATGRIFFSSHPGASERDMDMTSTQFALTSTICASRLISDVWPDGFTLGADDGKAVRTHECAVDSASARGPVHSLHTLDLLVEHMVHFLAQLDTNGSDDPEAHRAAFKFVSGLIRAREEDTD